MCLVGAVVACWPLKQEVAGSVGTNNFVIEFAEFSKIFRKNSSIPVVSEKLMFDELQRTKIC